GKTERFLICTSRVSKSFRYRLLTGPQPSSSRPWVFRISHPPSAERKLLTFFSIHVSMFSCPIDSQLKRTGSTEAGISLREPAPPVRIALILDNAYFSSSGVEELNGKLKTASEVLK